MAVVRLLNHVVTGGNYLVWNLKNVLKSAGWTVTRSGSGRNGVFAESDVFSHAVVGSAIVYPSDPHPPPANVGIGVGSEALGGPRCWLVLRDPSGRREVMFVRRDSKGSTYDAYWWVGYSKAAHFTGGAADVPAAATDEQTVSVTGTKTTPTGQYTAGNAANGPERLFIAAHDAPSAAGEYGWICLEEIEPNQVHSITCLDALLNAPTTSVHGDPHGLALVEYVGEPLINVLVAGYPRTWVDVGGTGQAWSTVRYSMPGVTTYGYFPKWAKASLYDGEERIVRVVVADPVKGGYLGLSQWFAAAAYGDGLGRDYPHTGGDDDAGPRAYLYASDVMLVGVLDGATVPTSLPAGTPSVDYVVHLVPTEVEPTPPPDPTKPVVTWVEPAPGVSVLPGQTVTFDVTDQANNLRRVLVGLVSSSTGETELAFDATAFTARYAAGSYLTPIANGLRFTMKRTGGWLPGSITVRVWAVDTVGNIES